MPCLEHPFPWQHHHALPVKANFNSLYFHTDRSRDSWDGTILTCDGCVQPWGCAQLCIVPERISGHLATSFTNLRAEEREQRRHERGTKTVYETNFIEIRSTRKRLQYKYNFLRSFPSPQIPHSAAVNSKPSAAQPSHTCHPQRSLCLPASPSWPE